MEERLLEKYQNNTSKSKDGNNFNLVKSLDRRAIKKQLRSSSPAPSILSAAVSASKSNPDVPKVSRQDEKKQLQGLNTRLAGVIDKVWLIKGLNG